MADLQPEQLETITEMKGTEMKFSQLQSEWEIAVGLQEVLGRSRWVLGTSTNYSRDIVTQGRARETCRRTQHRGTQGGNGGEKSFALRDRVLG